MLTTNLPSTYRFTSSRFPLCYNCVYEAFATERLDILSRKTCMTKYSQQRGYLLTQSQRGSLEIDKRNILYPIHDYGCLDIGIHHMLK